ncbi:MFS transporter [Allokutzneria sp. A3M-2-11 16]|uniref:MFS transporter n=1 Tax=Allokutzneria sp. A3M-2-11 16 TaxID=2962043 RepID=UPI0020B75C6C|nr:MFS transporter [Allokutzneria sp. A3M-2-11 16]MCP3798458.1 MFS transporter [Allokutzneria sp. A3M-2-11 16]
MKVWRGDKQARILICAALVDSTGTGMFASGAVLFYSTVVGVPLALVGVGMAFSAAVGMIAAVPVARLADRLGVVRMLTLLSLWHAVWFTAIAVLRGTVGFFVVMTMIGLTSRATQPVNQAAAGLVLGGDRRTTTLATIRSVRNIGMAAGSGLAGLSLAVAGTDGYPVLVLGNALSFVLNAILLRRLRATEQDSAPVKARSLSAVGDWRYMLLGVANGVLALHVSMLFVALPLWTANRNGIPEQFAPLLLTVNTVLVVLLQVPLSKRVDVVGAAGKAIVRAGVSLAVACACAATAALVDGTTPTVVLLLAALVALTVAEVLQTSAAWVISHDLAPQDRRAEYIAAFSLGMALQQVIGPPLFSSVVVPLGPGGWMALGAVVLSASIAYQAGATRLLRRREMSWPTG